MKNARFVSRSVLFAGLMLMQHVASAVVRPCTQHGWYGDLLVGYGSTSKEKSAILYDGPDSGLAFTGALGYHFAHYFAVELGLQGFPTGTDNNIFGTLGGKFVLPMEQQPLDLFAKVDLIALYYSEEKSFSFTTANGTSSFAQNDVGSKAVISGALGATYWISKTTGITGLVKYGVGGSSDSIGDCSIYSAMVGVSWHA